MFKDEYLLHKKVKATEAEDSESSLQAQNFNKKVTLVVKKNVRFLWTDAEKEGEIISAVT